MKTNDFFPAWIMPLDRIVRGLPNQHPARDRLRSIRDRMARVIEHGEGDPLELEADLREAASEHADLFLDALEQVMRETFQSVDPEVQRLRESQLAGTLNERDRASAQNYLSLLKEFQRILGKPDAKNGVHARDSATPTPVIEP